VRGDAAIAAAVRDAAAERIPLRIVGRGSWLDAGAPVHAARTLAVGDDTGVVAYSPGDLCITARAGTTLGELGAALAEHDQWLALDPDGGAEGTIGATVATGSYGPSAALYGATRSQLLGVVAVTGSGEIIRPGGRVAKNVAGFDLTRLLTGSWGTLGIITEVTLRVRPRAQMPGAVEHLRRPHTAGSGCCAPANPAGTARLAAALRAVFDPAGILNPGILDAPAAGETA